MSKPREASLPLARIVVYALPATALGFTGALISMYLLKFSTDVLLIPAGVMGLLFGISRLWDAFSDPLAGYWSDRTRTRVGRRRPWLLAAAVPLGLVFVGLWSPPASLTQTQLIVWMGAGILLFYTAQTALSIPHLALGAEMSQDYHERSRVFGIRLVLEFIGIFAAAGALGMMQSAADQRGLATALTALGAVALVGLVALSALRVRERPEYQGRGGASPFAAFGDVWRNPHARLLIWVFFLDQLGFAALITVSPYFIEYILNEPTMAGPLIGSAIGAALVFYPIWLPLSRRFGKRDPWIVATLVKACAFGSLLFIGPGDWLAVGAAVFVIGGIQGAAGVLGPSIKADVIDWDEFQTGERKEGAYFAGWNLATKAASGFAIIAVGFILQAAGFRPNVEQTETSRLAIIGMYSIVPFALNAGAALLLMRFRFNSREHAEIRAALDARRPGSAAA